MMKIVFLFLFQIGVTLAFCQELTSKRFVKTDSFKCEFYVSNRNLKDFQIQDSLTYYWCKAQKLLVTQGGVGGKVIDGNFLKFYHSGQLAEKGFFRMGLKHGIWKTWYLNGSLRSIYHYRNGRKNGNYALFDEQGFILKNGKYANDKPKVKRTRNKAKGPKKEFKGQEKGKKKESKIKIKEISFWERFRSKFKLDKQKSK